MFIIILTAINLSSVSALEINLTSPDSVFLNEKFEVSITADTLETHDVKIYVEDENSKTISQILNGNEWKSSYYYIKAAFPETKEFKLKITKQGIWNICLRIRKDGTSNPVCNEISVISSSAEENEEEPSNSKENNSSEEQTKTEQKIEKIPEQTNTTIQEIPNTPLKETTENKRIVLNSKPQNTQTKSQEIFTTKKEKTRLAIIYGFAVFSVVIIILMALRKL